MSLTEPWNSRRSLADLDPLAPGTEGNLGSNEGKSRTSVFWFVLVLGAGLMAPWNSWVLAYRYFDMVFNCHEGMEKNAECEEDSYHLVQYHFTTAFYVPTGLAVLLMLTRRGERVSIRARVVFALVLNVAVLLVVPAFVLAGTFSYIPRGGTPADSWVWYAMLGTITLSGINTGVLYGSLFSYITVLPARYTQACMAGVAMSGAVLDLTWVVIKLISGLLKIDNLEAKQHAQVISFFCISAGLSMACIPVFIKLRRSPLVAYFKEQQDKVKRTRPRLSQHMSADTGGTAGIEGGWDSGASINQGRFALGAMADDRVIFAGIKPYALSVMWNFAVTVAIFPGLVTAQFHYSSAEGLDESWYEVWLISVFMLGDWAGRAIHSAAFHPVPNSKSSGKMMCAVLLRTLFVPVYGAIALSTDQSTDFSPSFLRGLVEFVVMGCFAFSNGYCSTLAMTLAPWALSQDHERRRASVVMTAFTLTGCVLGALLAYVWPALMGQDMAGSLADAG